MTQWEYKHLNPNLHTPEGGDANKPLLDFWDAVADAGREGWELVGPVELSTHRHLIGKQTFEYLVFKRPVELP